MNNISNNQAEVKKIMINYSNKSKKNVSEIVNNEIEKQADDFKSRLEEKRKKKALLSTSDLTEQIDTLVLFYL